MAWWSSLLQPVSDVLVKGLDIVDDMVPDKDLAAKLKAELEIKMTGLVFEQIASLLKAQTSIIMAEAQGESWLQRNWRPLTMSSFVVIIVNNYIFAPYLGMLIGPDYKLMLEIPPDMWDLLKLGLSGYVVGRSVEKIAAGTGIKGAARKIMG